MSVTSTRPGPAVDVRRASSRPKTRTSWLDSKHSFSFGRHYDPANTRHGLLLVNNDDVVAPGTGFETHPHQDMEIVTWVLRGCLVHQDSTGHNGVIYPGLAQRMSAGTGILHSEKNDASTADLAAAGLAAGDRASGLATADLGGIGGGEGNGPVHFVQMWVLPDTAGVAPGYEQLEIDDELLRGGLVPVASGMSKHDGAAAIRIHNRHAALHAARLRPGQTVDLPDAPFVHLFVPDGTVELEGTGRLDVGDAVRFTGTGGQRVTAARGDDTAEGNNAAGSDGAAGAEILVWEMHATVGRG